MIFFLLISFVVGNAFASQFFAPEDLLTWEYETITKYYLPGNKGVLFCADNHFVSEIKTITNKAIKNGQIMVINDPSDFIFNSQEKLEQNLQIFVPPKTILIIDPSLIKIFKKKNSLSKYQYLLKILNNHGEINSKLTTPLDLEIRNHLKNVKLIAKNNCQNVSINFFNFYNNNVFIENYIFSVPKSAKLKVSNKLDRLLCVICLDQEKNFLLEPCHHLCICQTCFLKSSIDKCPLCNKGITSTKKVYL